MVRSLKEREHDIGQSDKYNQGETSFMLYNYLKGGRHKARWSFHSPFIRRLLNIWRASRIGTTSKKISDRTHMKSYEFSKYLAYKWTLFRVQRQLSLFAMTIGSFCTAYVYCGLGKNWFSTGYNQGSFQPDDFSRGVMTFFGTDDKKRYLIQHSL